jgi:hypothetical protein
MTTTNTGAASLSDEQKKQIAAVVHRDCTLLPGANFYTAAELAIQATLAQISRATPTPQADAAPVISGHAINDLFLKWSEWTTELGEAISRKNIDGFVSELRAAIAAGGAQEPVAQWQSRPLKSNHEWINLDESDAKRIAERHSDIYEVRALYAAPLPRVAETGALTEEQREAIGTGIAAMNVCGWTHRVPVLRALLAASNGEQA